jgi:alkanesulfonate monooxygenase SsuD/methylene tetrahydromethanopterin reductase-like flavin-dependent oxidoreductase (luciferase family)
MRFGFFDQLPCASGYTERPCYRDILKIELGDELGFDTAWLGEFHFSRAFSILADQLMALAAAAQRTHPLHNLVKIVTSRYCRLTVAPQAGLRHVGR